METKWLEDFLALARTRNFSRASEERHVTQPAFSRRIRALESWIGVTLFDRRTYPVTLTPEGRTFRETAENVLAELYRERAQFQERLHANRPDLRIAAATTLNLNFIPGWLRGLEPRTGHLTTHIITQNFHDMVHHLAEGQIDLVLQYAHADVPLLFDTSQFKSRTLASEPMILVSPVDKRGKPLFTPDSRKSGQPIPYTGYSQDGYFADVEKLLFARHPDFKARVKRLSESPTSEFLKRMAMEYGALTFLPESCARDELKRGVLVQYGGAEWQWQLDIQLYRMRDNKRATVQRLWEVIGGDED